MLPPVNSLLALLQAATLPCSASAPLSSAAQHEGAPSYVFSLARPLLQAGDTVLFSKYSSSDVETAGGEVCFVAQRSILAKLS